MINTEDRKLLLRINNVQGVVATVSVLAGASLLIPLPVNPLSLLVLAVGFFLLGDARAYERGLKLGERIKKRDYLPDLSQLAVDWKPDDACHATYHTFVDGCICPPVEESPRLAEQGKIIADFRREFVRLVRICYAAASLATKLSKKNGEFNCPAKIGNDVITALNEALSENGAIPVLDGGSNCTGQCVNFGPKCILCRSEESS